MRTATVVLVMALAGCGGTATETAAPEVKCETVPAGLLAAIGGDETLTNGRAYKSPDYESVYFVAADLASGDAGVWATNSLEPGGGMIMAVDGFAQEFTDWPDADKTSAEISKADPAVSVVKDCAA